MNLYDHQKTSLGLLSAKPRVLDFSDPGTGKTLVELLDFAARRDAGGGCALVLCTRSTIRSVWFEDAQKFTPQLRVSLAYAANREEAFGSGYDMYVTNHDAAKWLAVQPARFFERFDTLIVDESTAFKHASSQRSKALRKIAQHFAYRRALTGSPTSNGICDVWHQALLIDDGARLGRSFFQFRAAVCTPEQVGPRPEHLRWVDRPGAEAAVAGLLQDIVIRHKFEECVDIPPNHRYSVPFVLASRHQAIYEKLQKDATIALLDSTVTAVNAAALYTKLLQCASGAVYNDAGGYSRISTDRYELVMDLVEERPHSIVFFLWQHQKEELIQQAEARKLSYAVFDGTVTDKERPEIIKHFAEGRYRTVFAHPQSAAHGLTMVRGIATIWASPTINLEHFLQGLRRIYRIGQDKTTETIVVVAKNTIDELVWHALEAKDVRMSSLLDTLKEMVNP